MHTHNIEAGPSPFEAVRLISEGLFVDADAHAAFWASMPTRLESEPDITVIIGELHRRFTGDELARSWFKPGCLPAPVAVKPPTTAARFVGRLRSELLCVEKATAAVWAEVKHLAFFIAATITGR